MGIGYWLVMLLFLIIGLGIIIPNSWRPFVDSCESKLVYYNDSWNQISETKSIAIGQLCYKLGTFNFEGIKNSPEFSDEDRAMYNKYCRGDFNGYTFDK